MHVLHCLHCLLFVLLIILIGNFHGGNRFSSKRSEWAGSFKSIIKDHWLVWLFTIDIIGELNMAVETKAA